MGIQFPYPGKALDENMKCSFMKSLSFNDNNVNRPKHSGSLIRRDSEPSLKAFGSGKMTIEGSRSFKGKDLQTSFLVMCPTSENESFTRTASFKRSRIDNSDTKEMLSNSTEIGLESPKHEAAVKLQKVYKSFRTRRRLADCAVLVEQRWWKLLDFALLKRSSVSFFDNEKPESAVSRWSRAKTRVAKVGKGLLKDVKAQKLALQHWLEAIDPRHRYGHNLHFYYVCWLHCGSRQPFFYWLDVGEGKEVNLERCPRTKLQQQCIKYLGPKERESYEVVVEDGKFFYKQNHCLLDTTEVQKGSKWIFVLSTSKNLFVGQKKKGKFQHSSFLAGGATSAAGRLVVENGILKAVWPHSGHYRPTKENFQELMSFLKENNVDLTDVKKDPIKEDEESDSRLERSDSFTSSSFTIDSTMENCDSGDRTEIPQHHASDGEENDNLTSCISSSVESKLEGRVAERDSTSDSPHDKFHKRNLFEDRDENEAVVPQELILRRVNSRKSTKSLQLGSQLSCRWTSGAGPRIGCVRDYPSELQFHALEQVKLSPRSDGSSRAYAFLQNITSLSPKPLVTSLTKEAEKSLLVSDERDRHGFRT